MRGFFGQFMICQRWNETNLKQSNVNPIFGASLTVTLSFGHVLNMIGHLSFLFYKWFVQHINEDKKTQYRFLMSHSFARYVFSLAPLTPVASFAVLSLLCLLAPFLGLLTHFAHSLVWQWNSYGFTLKTRLTGKIAFVVDSGNTPIVILMISLS